VVNNLNANNSSFPSQNTFDTVNTPSACTSTSIALPKLESQPQHTTTSIFDSSIFSKLKSKSSASSAIATSKSNMNQEQNQNNTTDNKAINNKSSSTTATENASTGNYFFCSEIKAFGKDI
jgi:hypothetical protein